MRQPRTSPNSSTTVANAAGSAALCHVQAQYTAANAAASAEPMPFKTSNTIPPPLLPVPHPCHLQPQYTAANAAASTARMLPNSTSTMAPTLLQVLPTCCRLQVLYTCCRQTAVHCRRHCCKCCTHAACHNVTQTVPCHRLSSTSRYCTATASTKACVPQQVSMLLLFLLLLPPLLPLAGVKDTRTACVPASSPCSC